MTMQPLLSSADVRFRPAVPLEASHLAQRMLQCLIHEDAENPSLAQSLTRLFHLERSVFDPEAWKELDWLIREGWHFHQRRERKHPLWKVGPRRRFQDQIDHHFHRATVCTLALLCQLEPHLRRHATHRGQLTSLPLPVSRLGTGKPSVADDAATIVTALPSFEILVAGARSIAPDDETRRRIDEAWGHASWHAREVAPEAGRRRAPWKAHLRQGALNRLLHISLEQLQWLLVTARDLHVQAASGISGRLDVAKQPVDRETA